MIHSSADILRYHFKNLGLCTVPSAGSSWPCFVDFTPIEPIECIVLSEITSRPGVRSMRTGQNHHFPGIQILVRSQDQLTSKNQINVLCQVCDASANQIVTIGDKRYLLNNISRSHDPIFMERHIHYKEREGDVPFDPRRPQFSYVVNVYLTHRKPPSELLPQAFNPTDITIWSEQTPVGAIDGSNTVYTITALGTKIPMLYINNILRTDYTISGTTLTMTTPPSIGSTILLKEFNSGN